MISLFLLFILSFLNPTVAYAQSAGPDQVLQVSTTPENPGPGDTVTVSIKNFSYNLDRADISWYVNDILKKEAVGLKTFSTTVGQSGTKTNIRVSIKTFEGPTIEQIFAFNPGDVTLVWEAGTYVPIWYKGKALFTPEAVGKVVAVPHIVENGVVTDSAKLIYNWTDNGSIKSADSGYGKNAYFFFGDVIARPRTIGVTVTSKTSNIRAYKEIVVSAVEPKIMIYKNNPTYGLEYNKSVSSEYNMSESELSLQAFPFFYSVDKAASPNINYTWYVNGATTYQKDPLISFRNDGKKGTSNIKVSAENIKKILQAAENSFSIKFGEVEQKNGFSI